MRIGRVGKSAAQTGTTLGQAKATAKATAVTPARTFALGDTIFSPRVGLTRRALYARLTFAAVNRQCEKLKALNKFGIRGAA
jgi:hypothetical protein